MVEEEEEEEDDEEEEEEEEEESIDDVEERPAPLRERRRWSAEETETFASPPLRTK